MSSREQNAVDRRGFLSRLAPLAAAGLSPMAAATDEAETPAGELLIAGRRAMACRFAVHLPRERYGDGMAAACRALDRVDTAEHLLSVYRDDTEVARINREAAREPCAIGATLAALLVRSRSLWQATGGAFDVAAGALVRCWKDHLRRGERPSEEAIEAARACSGMHLVQITGQTVSFARKGVRLDFGANGKGYALDCAAAALAEAGITEALLHGGHSSLLAAGAPPWDDGWRVSLRHPVDPSRTLAVLRLRDCALATSGNLEQGVTLAGERLGHLIDPRTGRPANAAAGVTVVAPTAEEADALSTAFFALGEAEVRRYCEQNARTGALVVPPPDGAGAIRALRIGAIEDTLIEVTV